MTERQYERRDIILELIGMMVGVGETNNDKKVLKNLDFAEEIITCLLENLSCNIAYTGYEASMLEIKEKSEQLLEFIKEVAE